MPAYMICYQFTDEDGRHFASLFSDAYEQVFHIMNFLVSGADAYVQLYQWDSDNKYYIFLKEVNP